jgi:sulfur carrier protein
MQISVNGHNTEVPGEFSMAALIEHMDLTGKRIAVEVNAELVPRTRFPEHRLQPGDRVEIIHAVGGG